MYRSFNDNLPELDWTGPTALPPPRSRHPAPTPPPTGWAPVKNINNHLITFGTKLNLRAHRNIKHYIINTKKFFHLFLLPQEVYLHHPGGFLLYIYIYVQYYTVHYTGSKYLQYTVHFTGSKYLQYTVHYTGSKYLQYTVHYTGSKYLKYTVYSNQIQIFPIYRILIPGPNIYSTLLVFGTTHVLYSRHGTTQGTVQTAYWKQYYKNTRTYLVQYIYLLYTYIWFIQYTVHLYWYSTYRMPKGITIK